MQMAIAEALTQLEQNQEFNVLFACESGSRAWGFPSPDSDYDVRFLYVHKLSYYLSLGKRPDTYDQMLPGDLDVSGWELGKALKLLAGSNIPLFEWLQSPVVYRQNQEFIAALRSEIGTFFNPKKAMFHYLKLAQNSFGKDENPENLTIKKLLYVARALVCTLWIARHQTMPSTDVHVLLAEEDLIPLEIKQLLKELIAQKQHQKEAHKISLKPFLTDWIHQTSGQCLVQAEAMVVGKIPGVVRLEPLFRAWVLQFHNQN